jgi:Icc-related predicted phosphoesterase
MKIPDGDVLVHSGDATMWGTEEEIDKFVEAFLDLPHKHKVFVPGNHDFGFQEDEGQRAKFELGVHYLVDNEIVIDGVKFYGSPWQGDLKRWAWYCKNTIELKAHWDAIPDDTDVLVTHVPPHEILDKLAPHAMAKHGGAIEPHIGCIYLKDAALNRVQPRLHIFGHIHESYGSLKVDKTTFINAAVMNEHYHLVNEPIIINIESPNRD